MNALSAFSRSFFPAARNPRKPDLNALSANNAPAPKNDAPVASIRSLLRDTALLATTLATSGATRDVATLRAHCLALIDQFGQALKQHGHAEDVIRDIQLAQCALLDEIALRRLPANDRATWEVKPLQVERFSLHDAGERVFDRLEARMRQSAPNVDLLEGYAAILGMGFLGRYAREGETQRTELIAALNAQIEKLRVTPDHPFIVDHQERHFSDWLYRFSPWAIAAGACSVAFIVWLVWQVALNAQLAHLLSGKAIQP